jgi:hypothetical protein
LIAREVGGRRSESNSLGNLGNAYAALSEMRKAIEFHQQALLIAHEIGDRRGEGISLYRNAPKYFVKLLQHIEMFLKIS